MLHTTVPQNASPWQPHPPAPPERQLGHVSRATALFQVCIYHSSTTSFQGETLTAVPKTDSPRCFQQSRVEARRLVPPPPFSPRSPKDRRVGHAVSASRLETTLLRSSSFPSSSPPLLGNFLRSDQHQAFPSPPRRPPVLSLGGGTTCLPPDNLGPPRFPFLPSPR